MTPIEKFIKESYIPTIEMNQGEMSCVLKHKDSLTENGVVVFHKWNKNETKGVEYLIVEEHIDDIYMFLITYYNLMEEDKKMVKEIVVGMSIDTLNSQDPHQ